MDETSARDVLAHFGPGPRVAERVMRIYVITEGAADAPAGSPFGVREHVVEPGVASPRPGWLMWAPDLHAARLLVPAQADYRMPRAQADDPVIVETWL